MPLSCRLAQRDPPFEKGGPGGFKALIAQDTFMSLTLTGHAY
jgi:hypothetical protein